MLIGLVFITLCCIACFLGRRSASTFYVAIGIEERDSLAMLVFFFAMPYVIFSGLSLHEEAAVSIYWLAFITSLILGIASGLNYFVPDRLYFLAIYEDPTDLIKPRLVKFYSWDKAHAAFVCYLDCGATVKLFDVNQKLLTLSYLDYDVLEVIVKKLSLSEDQSKLLFNLRENPTLLIDDSSSIYSQVHKFGRMSSDSRTYGKGLKRK